MLAERITPMGLSKTIWTNPTEFLKHQQPENPVLFFAPRAVQAVGRRFLAGFPGLVTYAVKSNPGEEIVENYREFCEDWPLIPFLAVDAKPQRDDDVQRASDR